MGTVCWSPMSGIFDNKSAGTVIIGGPGSGKTFGVLNLASNCLLTNQRIIVLDGKNDTLVLKKIYPKIDIVDINNVKDGGLDPFKVIKNVSSNVILSVIECITGKLTKEMRLSISPIIQDFVKENKRYEDQHVRFKDLVNYLYSHRNTDAQSVATAINLHKDSEYGRFLLGDNEDDKDDFELSNNSQIISLFGMSFPSSDRDDNLKPEERFTSAIMYIICYKLNQILKEDSSIPTVLFLDEAKILFADQSLAKIVEDFLVLGRSLNTATVLATQNITHIPDSLSNLFSTKFMFRSQSSQAEEFLRRFNNSDDSGDSKMNERTIVSYVASCDSGNCFMIDPWDRGGFIRITSNLGLTSNPLLKDR